MVSNVSLESAGGALGLLGAGVVLALLGIVFVHAELAWRRGRGRAALAACASVAGLCVALLLAFSLAGREEVKAFGAEKYFCGIDSHLAYTVVGVRRAKTLGGARAAGEFHIVTLRTRFDEEPAGAARPLTPNPRRVEIRDERGRAFAPSEVGSRALAAAGAAGSPLDTPLGPGQSYTTELVFDLPDDARRPSLLVSESILPTRLHISRENSLLQRRTRFELGP